jgi:two-component system, OmpR family, phosphate regulon response regulator PhoB
MIRGNRLNSQKSQVLLVDDEAAFAVMLRYNLETHGFRVDHVTNGQEALSRIRKTQPHILLLDWTLPGVSGIEVCRRLRSRPETKDLRVIMVTGRTGDRNAVRGLNAGADDYIVKPFSVAELLARIRALLRRSPAFPAERWLHWREIAMDLAAFRVTRNGREIHLGPTEFRLLKLLLQNPKHIFSRQELIEAVWGADVYVQYRTVDAHVLRLRRSINRDGAPEMIRTVRMVGYGLEIE